MPRPSARLAPCGTRFTRSSTAARFRTWTSSAAAASCRSSAMAWPGPRGWRRRCSGRSVHAGFYLSPHTISLGIIGPGAVGSVLLDQLASQAARLTRDFHIDLRLRGVMTSRAMALSETAIPLGGWRDALGKGKPPDMLRFEDHVNAEHLPHAVILDCSASDEVARQYPRWLGAGIHVVTPNKRANSGPLELYDDLHEARRAAGSHYLYEATVGAGLPIIQTLRDLRETGDEIRRIEGILSGTLAYLFNVWDGTQP